MARTKSVFADFVRRNFGTGKQAALALGVSPYTIYNQMKHATGGYKVLADVWQKYISAKERCQYLQETYTDLATRYNELAKTINGSDSVTEYLKG